MSWNLVPLCGNLSTGDRNFEGSTAAAMEGIDGFTQPVEVVYKDGGEEVDRQSYNVRVASANGGIALTAVGAEPVNHNSEFEKESRQKFSEERPIKRTLKKVAKKVVRVKPDSQVNAVAEEQPFIDTVEVVDTFLESINLSFLRHDPVKPECLIKFDVSTFSFKQAYHAVQVSETDSGLVLITVYDKRYGDVDTLNKFPYNEEYTLSISFEDLFIQSPGTLLTFDIGPMHINIFAVLQEPVTEDNSPYAEPPIESVADMPEELKGLLRSGRV